VQQEGNPDSLALSTPLKIQPITFGQFAAFARRRGMTVGELAKRFHNRIERPAEFFNRVLSPHHSANVIPYKSVIEFFLATEAANAGPACACGCGRPVFDRKKWATSGCKKKAAREKVPDMQIRLPQTVDFVDARRGQIEGVGTLPLISTEQR
jgi:hypothetical protein